MGKFVSTDRDRSIEPPTLSVVVPIYNVEAYLDECLESIAAQVVQDFEVIMVDDGSTDQSGAIAERWAARDSRFRLVRQENHGLGHARNTGADCATGTYLTFLDSDDVASTSAYRIMIDTLEKTGSDFATGNIHRFDSSGNSWQDSYFRGIARTERLATHVSRDRGLLRDHLAPNKVWRTVFWRDSGIRFPVGVLYEDVPTIVPLHVRARAVDVVPVVSALWRKRDQGDTSITQNRRRDPVHVRDRLAAVLANSRYIAEHADQDLKDDYDHHVLSRELRVYVDLYSEVNDVYRAQFVSSATQFVKQVSEEALRRTPADLRIAYELLMRGSINEFAEFVRRRRANEVEHFPVSIRHGRAIMEFDLARRENLANAVCDLTDELRVLSRVTDLSITSQALVIEGWAYISRLPIDDPEQHNIAIWLDGPTRVLANVEYRRDPRAAAEVGAEAEATGRVAFTATIPLHRLQRRWWRSASTWTVMVSVANAGISLSGSIARPMAGKAERALMVELRGGQWLRVCWSDDGLTCRLRREAALLDDVRVRDGGFDIYLRTKKPAGPEARLRVRNAAANAGFSLSVIREPSDGRLARARLGPDEIQKLLVAQEHRSINEVEEHVWHMSYRGSRSDRSQHVLDPVGVFGQSITSGAREVSIRRSRAATVGLVCQSASPLLTKAVWLDGATLCLSMVYQGAQPVQAVVVRAQHQDEHVTFPVTQQEGELVAVLPVASLERFGESVPIRSGTWDVNARTLAGEVPVRPSASVIKQLPSSVTRHGRSYTISDHRRQRVALVVGSDLKEDEIGNVNQRRLQVDFYPRAKTQLQNSVLYESYFGQQFSDSPREIFAELRRRGVDVEHLVAVRDQQFNVPDGATAVPYRSTEYYRALARSRYVISNSHLLGCFEKSPGQTVVQTWHGVGTKKIGLDLDTVHFANRSYIDRLRNGESDNWDYLISPNAFTSPILARAFAFRGTLLETGVPRNDLFYRPEREELAIEVKKRLGVDPDCKIVTYAPTWRDHLHRGGRYRLDLRFNLYEAAARLGDDFAFLFRTHANVSDRLPAGDGAVIDASDYPDVQELLLVTDILISDYSTLMCDFANTGRPMLFYTYDLANYRDVLRGFYFDFENDVPGPLITDEADLVPAILDADKIRSAYDAKYERFAKRFCSWDDGYAAARVVDAVFKTTS